MRYASLGQFLLVCCLFPLDCTLIVAGDFEYVSSIHTGSDYNKVIEYQDYWLLAGHWGLECWQFDAVDTFVKVSEVRTPGRAQWVAAEGSYAYVADGWDGLSIVDISTPAEMRFVTNYIPPPIEFESYPGRFSHVSVLGDLVYLSGVGVGTSVIDVSDKANPIQVSRLYFADTTDFGVNDFCHAGLAVPYEGGVYQGFPGTPDPDDYPIGIYQYDMTDPSSPGLLRFYSTSYLPSVLVALDSLLIGAGHSSCQIYTICETDSLCLRDSLPDIIFHVGEPIDLSVSGEILYLTGKGGASLGGITSVKISELSNLQYVEDFMKPMNFRSFAADGSRGVAAYLGANLLVTDIKPDGTADSSQFIDTRSNIRDAAVKGSALFLADYKKHIAIYDVSSPDSPTLDSTIIDTHVVNVKVIGNYLGVGRSNAYAHLYMISDPFSPQLVDSIDDISAVDFELANNLLFVGSPDGTSVNQIHADSVTPLHPANPLTGSNSLTAIDSLLIANGVISLIGSDGSLSPLSYPPGGTAATLTEHYYVTSNGYLGAFSYDVSNPTYPVFVSHWDTLAETSGPGDGFSIGRINNDILLLDGDWGVTILGLNPDGTLFFRQRIRTAGMALEAAHNQDILIIADFNGAELIKYDQVVSTQGEAELPESFKFFQNYPNPFNSETNVSFRVQEPGHATLEIVDILGRRVVRLLDAQVGVGTHNILWNAKDVDGKEVASGVYFVTLSFNERRITRKMIFLK